MKRISSKRSELSKNIWASLGINSPVSPAAEDNGGRPHRDASSAGGPAFRAPQRSASDPSSPALEFNGSGGPLPPLLLQLGRKPSFLVVTPAHLRRPGPSSPSVNVPMNFGEGSALRLPRGLAEDGGVLKAASAASARRGNENRAPRPDPEITVAVRVRPVAAAGRTAPGSDRRCLLIERRGAAVDTAGREAVSARQQQAHAKLEKLVKNGGEGKSSGGGPEEAGGWPRLLVTVPGHVQGTNSIAAATRRFSGFDRVFDDAASQEDVYAGAVDGLLSDNGPGAGDLTLIACGHRKSGKSYTLFGSTFDSAPARSSSGPPKPPPVLVKRGSAKLSGRHPETENLQPGDGLLQRAVARLIASAARPISMSYAQIMPTADLPKSSQGVSAGLFTGSERVVDLLTGETRYETEGQNFWSRLVKAPVGSLLDVNGRLRDGRRFWSHEGHAIVSFEFADRAGHARRLVLVDAAITDAQQAASVPPFGASQQRLTSDSGAIALDKLFADARFAAKNMVLIATVSQEAGSAAETMATLVSAGEVLANRKAKGGPRGKPAPRDREGARPSGGDAAAAPSRSSSFSGGGADADAFPDLHPLLREELEANRALTRELDEVADELAGAQRELARARLRERELMLDVSAAHGSLMALAQERDFEQAALLEAAAAAAEARAKRSSLVEERERLRRVIAGITGGWGVGPDGRLLARAAAGSDGGAAGKSVADALATFASGHAEAHAAAELLRRDLEERDRQLEKARRVLSRESRTRAKLELRLGAAAAAAAAAADDDDDDFPGDVGAGDPLSPAGSAPPNRPASWTSTTSTTARALAPSPSAPPAVSAAAAASSKASPAGHLPLLTLDVAVGSSPLHLRDSRWTDDIARLDVAPRAKPDAAAAAAAEWEKSAGERQDHRRAAANVLGVDLPADLASELENESEWEAMIAQFELDERRSTPNIRHRIYTADFAGSPY